MILWDEISMACNVIVHPFDNMLREVTNSSCPCSGKVIPFGGDFGQITPIILNGHKEDIINESFVSYYFFTEIIRLELTENL